MMVQFTCLFEFIKYDDLLRQDNIDYVGTHLTGNIYEML